MRHIIISPHMDDAVLSMGSYILKLIRGENTVRIITVFTAFTNGRVSWDSRKYLLKSGFLTAGSFERQRIAEDIGAMHALGTGYAHLGYTDGGFRTVANRLIYGSHAALFSGLVKQEDDTLTGRLSGYIRSHTEPDDMIYAPVGIGNHADHLIVRNAVSSLKRKALYWLDQPYALDSGTIPATSRFRQVFRVPWTEKKRELIMQYHSQWRLLFPSGIPHAEERFYEMTGGRK